MLNKFLLGLIIAILVGLGIPNQSFAACVNTNSCPSNSITEADENCFTISPGPNVSFGVSGCGGSVSTNTGPDGIGSYGTAVYNCGVDLNGDPYCNFHNYACDTPCGGGSSGPCPGECKRNEGNGCGSGFSPANDCGACGVDQFGVPKICCKNNNPNECNAGGPGGGACNVTAPTINSISRLSATSAKIDWTPGTGGYGANTQRLYVGANKSEVEGNCPGTASPSCVVKKTGLSNSLNTYTTSASELLQPGTVYYVRVVNYVINACQAASATDTHLSSCQPTVTNEVLNVGEDRPSATSVFSSSEITSVTYTSSNPSVATVTSPDNPAGSPYQTSIHGESAGSSTITHNVYFGAVLECSATGGASVLSVGPWWRVIDGDVSTNGNLDSDVPGGEYFNLEGDGGFPGIPVFGGSSNLTSSNVSSTGWLVNSLSTNSRIYDYAFFANQIPDDVIPTEIVGSIEDISSFNAPQSYYGYEWYKYTGPVDLNINSNINLTNRKIVLLVGNANVNINGNINLTDGVGFFGLFVNGRIAVNPTVAFLEGIYQADSSFETGLSALALNIRGSVAAYGGVSLQRDVADDSNPSEIFEYAPDQILLFPSKLGSRKINWKEVAP